MKTSISQNTHFLKPCDRWPESLKDRPFPFPFRLAILWRAQALIQLSWADANTKSENSEQTFVWTNLEWSILRNVDRLLRQDASRQVMSNGRWTTFIYNLWESHVLWHCVLYQAKQAEQLQEVISVKHFFFGHLKMGKRCQIMYNEVSNYGLCGQPPLWIPLTFFARLSLHLANSQLTAS